MDATVCISGPSGSPTLQYNIAENGVTAWSSRIQVGYPIDESDAQWIVEDRWVPVKYPGYIMPQLSGNITVSQPIYYQNNEHYVGPFYTTASGGQDLLLASLGYSGFTNTVEGCPAWVTQSDTPTMIYGNHDEFSVPIQTGNSWNC